MERVELTQLGEGGREELGFAERVQQPDFGKGRILLPSEELQTPAPPSLTCQQRLPLDGHGDAHVPKKVRTFQGGHEITLQTNHRLTGQDEEGAHHTV